MRVACVAGLSLLAALMGCQSISPALQVQRQPVNPQLLAHDASGSGNGGVNQGDPILGVPGRFGTAYSFSEEGSWIMVPDDPSLDPGRHNFLISAWVKLGAPPEPRQTMDLIRKGLHGTIGGEIKLEIVAGGRVKCTVKDKRLRDASKFGPMRNVADGTWHRVGCARTPGRLTAILDRRNLSKRVMTGAISNMEPLAIGSKYGLEDSPGGLLDEVEYYIAPPARGPKGRLLPLRGQLRELHSQENAVGLWHLDEQSPG